MGPTFWQEIRIGIADALEAWSDAVWGISRWLGTLAERVDAQQ